MCNRKTFFFIAKCVPALLVPHLIAATADFCLGIRPASSVPAWTSLCKGQPVDLQPSLDNDSDHAPFTPVNSLDGAGLRELLTSSLSNANNRTLTIRQARITGPVDLSGLEVTKEVQILDSTVEGDFKATGSHFRRSLCLQGTSLLRDVDLSGSQFDGGVYLGNEAKASRCGPEPFEPRHDISRRKIFKLNLNSVQAESDIYLKNFETDNAITAIHATSKSNVIFKECVSRELELRSVSAGDQINVVGCDIKGLHSAGKWSVCELPMGSGLIDHTLPGRWTWIA